MATGLGMCRVVQGRGRTGPHLAQGPISGVAAGSLFRIVCLTCCQKCFLVLAPVLCMGRAPVPGASQYAACAQGRAFCLEAQVYTECAKHKYTSLYLSLSLYELIYIYIYIYFFLFVLA